MDVFSVSKSPIKMDSPSLALVFQKPSEAQIPFSLTCPSVHWQRNTSVETRRRISGLMATHNHNVVFSGDSIHTVVTHDPTVVSQWVYEIVSATYCQPIIVGLDVEWRPSSVRDHHNPAATLQLCVGRACLIYQLLHSPYFPIPLFQFLSSPNNTFVGIGVKSDVAKIQRDCHFECNVNCLDLGFWAAEMYQKKELKNAGLKGLTKLVLGKELDKPKSVTMSEWDNQWLTPAQVQYACLDAFLSFEIGRVLMTQRHLAMANLGFVPFFYC